MTKSVENDFLIEAKAYLDCLYYEDGIEIISELSGICYEDALKMMEKYNSLDKENPERAKIIENVAIKLQEREQNRISR